QLRPGQASGALPGFVHPGHAAGDARREVTGQALFGGAPGRVDIHVAGGPAGRHFSVIQRAHATAGVAVHDEPAAAEVARLGEHGEGNGGCEWDLAHAELCTLTRVWVNA